MKLNATKAAFSFQRYVIRSVSFNEPLESQDGISVEFDPSGVFDELSKTFKLELRFIAKYGESNPHTLIDLMVEGYFLFDNILSFEEIPEYFYANSIAILFPYLRAFATVLTATGNGKPLILPTFNLSTLATPLKENTEIKTAGNK